MNKKPIAFIVIPFLLLLIVSISCCLSYAFAETESSQVRYASFIISEKGWVLELSVAFPWVWIAGSTVDIDFVFNIREVGSGSLTIYGLKVSTGEIEASTYVGSFSYVGEEKSRTLKLPTIDPRHIFSNKSSTLVDLYVEVRGYVEDVKSRDYFVRNFTIRAIPMNILPSIVKLSLSVDRYDSIYMVDVQALNSHPNPLYNSYLVVYVNGSLYASMFYNVVKPFNTTYARFPLYIDRQGVHIITVTMNYTSSEGRVEYAIASTRIYVKGIPKIVLQTNASSTQIFRAVKFYGSAEPAQGLRLVLEVSVDGIDWNRYAEPAIDYRGSFSYIWIPNTSGTYLFRVRNIETELLREGVSNTVAVFVERVKPTISLEIDRDVTEVGKQVKVRVSVEPRMKMRLELQYVPPNENTWRTYTSIVIDSSGVGETVFIPTKSGEYRLKVVVKENNEVHSAESLTKMLRVEEANQGLSTAVSQTHVQQPFVQEYRNYIVIALIIIAAIFSSLLYLRRR